MAGDELPPSGIDADYAGFGICGYQHTMNAYKAAVEEKYRFLVTVMRCLSRTIRRQLMSALGVIPRRWFKRWTVFLT